LLELRAGAHVTVEKVELDIKGVAARAMLKVRLENVYAILDRAYEHRSQSADPRRRHRHFG
jgi:hypothetical protein